MLDRQNLLNNSFLVEIFFIYCYYFKTKACISKRLMYNVIIERRDFMTNSLVQFRTDDTSKIKATNICEQLGIDLPTYLRICISRLVQENGIPFSMKLDKEIKNRGLESMKEASRIAQEYEISEMTLDEINSEIMETRKLK
jgi:DNA-damage-inducible protein J